MGDRFKTHRFDAAMGGLAATPTPSGVKQTWTGAAARDGGFNYGRYESARFDAQVDSAITAAHEGERAKAHYRAAYQTIVDDAPAIWLYEPPVEAGCERAPPPRRRSEPTPGGLGIPGWTIAPGKRLPRDAAPAASP